jgi:phenylacetate-CoA ligase
MRPWISKHLLYLPTQRIRREPVLAHLADLEASQWLSPDALRARQDERVRELVRHAARRVPYYREVFRAHGVDPESVRGTADLVRLPVLEKDVARVRVDDLVAEEGSARMDRRKTSGSTGIPMPVVKSRDAYARIRAIWYRYARWYGVDIGDRQGRFLGHPVGWRGVLKEDVQDLILNKHRLDPVYLTPERMRRYWRTVQRKPLDYVYGYASAMVAFARFLEDEREDPRRSGARVLFCTGENLYGAQRAYLAKAWGARVVNEWGCTESGVMAFECPEAGRLHLSADNLVIEFLAGDAPAAPGEPGDVVVTELYSPDAPLIRYRLGDVAVPGDAAPCPCGRGLPTLERIEGRTSEMILLPGGRQVHSEVFHYISDEISARDPDVESFRVRRTGAADFTVQLLASDTLAPETETALRASVARVLGADVRLAVEQVSELPRDPSGKLRYFVDETRGRPAAGTAA